MPSAPIYAKRREYKQCPRCGRRTKKGVLCKLHREMDREEKSRTYLNNIIDRKCVWSGCHKQAEPNRRMCKGHLTDNRVLAAERRRKKRCANAATA